MDFRSPPRKPIAVTSTRREKALAHSVQLGGPHSRRAQKFGVLGCLDEFGIGCLIIQRISMLPIDAKFIVQMWAGREPATADIADDFTLFNASALAQVGPVARQVGIHRAVGATVLDNDGPPIAAVPSDRGDSSNGGSANHGSRGGGVVDARVGAPEP